MTIGNHCHIWSWENIEASLEFFFSQAVSLWRLYAEMTQWLRETKIPQNIHQLVKWSLSFPCKMFHSWIDFNTPFIMESMFRPFIAFIMIVKYLDEGCGKLKCIDSIAESVLKSVHLCNILYEVWSTSFMICYCWCHCYWVAYWDCALFKSPFIIKKYSSMS